MPFLFSFIAINCLSDAIVSLLVAIPYASAGKESICNAGDLGLGLIPGFDPFLEKGKATHSMPRESHGL